MKKIYLLMVFFIFICSLTCITANTVDGDILTECDDSQVEENVNLDEWNNFDNVEVDTNSNLQDNSHEYSSEQRNMLTDIETTVSNYGELDDVITHDARNTIGSTYTINLVKKTYNINRTLLWGSSNYIKNLTIDGHGSTLNGQHTYQFINLAGEHNLTLKNLIIKNTVKGSTNSSGVVVMIGPGTLTIDNCTLSNNHGGLKGGVITNRGNTMVMNSKFINNTVDMWGAVIWSTGEYGGNIKFVNNTFRNNIANNLGNNDKTSIIYAVSGGISNITNNTFRNNTGRCIHAYNNIHSIIHSNKFISNNFTDNVNIIRGGVIDNYEASIDVINNTFSGITEGELRGGIIYNEIGDLLLKNNTFSNKHIAKGMLSNQTCSKGGVIFNRNSTIEINGNIFQTNFTGNYTRGGVIFNNMGMINIVNNTFNNIVHGYRVTGLTIFNDVNGIIDVTNNLFNSKINGTVFCNSTLQKFIYNSDVLNPSEGDGIVGISNIIKTNPIITVNSASANVGEYVNLTSNVNTDWNGKLNESYVIFKINGITLKDENNSVIKVDVINGKATLRFKIPLTWTQPSYTIESVYAGSVFFNGVRNNAVLTVPSNNNLLDIDESNQFNINDAVIREVIINGI
ncbi:MAG: hypothetical protein IJJ47_13485 [Methanosphaera sp.]|nr:hypothetical protein [Methanosphaera sp.]